MKIKKIIAFLLTFLFLGLGMSISYGGNAIDEYRENVRISEIISPSLFAVNVHGVYTDTDPQTNIKTNTFCLEGVGTAFTVNKNGYFSTNDHVITPISKLKQCLANVAKKRKVPIESLSDKNFHLYYALSDQKSPKHIFPVVVVASFPGDIAILNVSKVWGETEKELFKISPNYPKKFIPVKFRTRLPKVAKGPMSKRFLLVASYEPVDIMGMPLKLPNTIMRGMLGNNFFNQENFDYLHIIAPTAEGASGAPVYSLLDNRCIGMIRSGTDGQGGAIPFWEIQKALKEIDMK